MTAEDPLWRALARRARAAIDHEPELYATLVATLAATRLPAGITVCEPGLRHPNHSVREAARACIKELRGADPGPQAPGGPQPRPPVDPGRLAGQRVLWTLTTDHGDLKIDLDPEAAPWAVAMIVALTERGFYDGLTFHRDVPGFVMQGGDPEGTGWGGPGFTLPSEPSDHRFDRGAVGIADAGKDTGGSQFFFMHDRAPHLEGRYTWVGELQAQHHALLPLLTVGDRILRATVTIRPPRAAPDRSGAPRP
jgi:cyclophilin family peptidyl-prolyl cis-trans isomerase